jgi:hypothetical protein
MKHLRKFKESVGTECSFEDFKDIMLDILDDFNFEYEFHDYSSQTLDSGSPSNSFYDCWIYLYGKEEYAVHDDIPSMNINFLGFREDQTLPPTDDPEEITNDGINECLTSINDNISELETLKNNLNDIIKYQKDCVKLFESLKSTSKRLKGFPNCYHCGIGFNEGDLRITFEIKDEED